MLKKVARFQLRVESLEQRLAPVADLINLDLVALHEFGHSLGLQHHFDPSSIMHDGYDASYDLTMLANDPAVRVDPNDGYASLLEIYSIEAIAQNSTPWKDALDANPGDGIVGLTYSIMPDGTDVRGQPNVIHAVFNAWFGSGWSGTLSSALNRWGQASQMRISFTSMTDAGRPFNYPGQSQNDMESGDIRIGAINLDGPGGRLAETYFPPPNGPTAPGDVHFDAAEGWSRDTGGPSNGGGGTGGGGGTPPPTGGGGTPSHDTNPTGGGTGTPTGPAGTGGGPLAPMVLAPVLDTFTIIATLPQPRTTTLVVAPVTVIAVVAPAKPVTPVVPVKKTTKTVVAPVKITKFAPRLPRVLAAVPSELPTA